MTNIYAAALERQISEGERKGFDFSRRSMFTRVLAGRLRGLRNSDPQMHAELVARAERLGYVAGMWT